MALFRDAWGDAGPIPADLMEIEGEDRATSALGEALSLAESASVNVDHAAEMMIDAEGSGAWRITDDDRAEWAMRKLAAAEDELTTLEDRAEAYIEKIKRWHERAAREPRGTAEFMRAHLARYGEEQRAEGRKSVALPSGQIKTIGRDAAPEIADPDALLVWAKQNAPEIVRVREDVLVSELRERVEIQALPVESGEPGGELEYEPAVVTRRVDDEGTIIFFEPVPGAAVRDGSVSVTVKVDR